MILVVTDKSALLRCDPSPAVLAVAADLEGRRRWTAEGLRFEASRYNLDRVRTLEPRETGLESAEEWETGPSSYVSRSRPYAHQERALGAIRDAFALFMEQGTGKSKVAIDRAGSLWAAGKISAVLVYSKKGVHRQWVEEQIPKHFGSDLYDAAFWPLKSLPADLLRKDARLKWLSVNYDAAKSPRGKAAIAEFLEAHRGRVLTIADESQEIKNARSERFKAISALKKIAASPYRLLLTGTPIAKDLTDEWAQLMWLDEDILGIRYVSTFRARYCRMGGFEGRAVVGHKNVEEFRSLTAPYTFRATKDELGLIPPAFEEWGFDLSATQRKMIKSLKEELVADLANGALVSAANAAVGISKIQQVSNGFITDEAGAATSVVHPLDNPRLLALGEYLDSREGESVIVWARFREDIRLIAEMLDREGISRVEYHGGISDRQRAENVERFLSGAARVFVGNPQSGGTGLNLQGRCRNAVYYSNGYSAIDRWQSQDRIHRIGTTGAVVYTDLVARGGIDRAILANLRKKKSISELGIGELRQLLEEND